MPHVGRQVTVASDHMYPEGFTLANVTVESRPPSTQGGGGDPITVIDVHAIII